MGAEETAKTVWEREGGNERARRGVLRIRERGWPVRALGVRPGSPHASVVSRESGLGNVETVKHCRPGENPDR